jgi:hypothetical protein
LTPFEGCDGELSPPCFEELSALERLELSPLELNSIKLISSSYSSSESSFQTDFEVNPVFSNDTYPHV